MSCGLDSGGRPAPEQPRHDARGGPVTSAKSLERLSPTSARMRARPVIGRGPAAIAGLPDPHRIEYTRARPAPLDRVWMASLAVRVGAPLAVARLGVGAAAPAHPLIARLHCPRLLSCGVIEVRLDRRGRAAETPSDLGDRKTLRLAKVTRQRHTAAPLEHTVISPRGLEGRHAMEVLLRCGVVLAVVRPAQRAEPKAAPHSLHERTSTSAEDSSTAPRAGQLRSSCSALPSRGPERSATKGCRHAAGLCVASFCILNGMEEPAADVRLLPRLVRCAHQMRRPVGSRSPRQTGRRPLVPRIPRLSARAQ
jgi:hypothetical protein